MTAAARLIADPIHPARPGARLFTFDEEIGRGVEGLDFAKLGGVVRLHARFGSGAGDHRLRDVLRRPGDGHRHRAQLASVEAKAKGDGQRGADSRRSSSRGCRPTASPGSDRRNARVSASLFDRRRRRAGVGADHPPRLRDAATWPITRDLLRSIAAELQAEHPAREIDVQIKKQYRNMRDGLAKEPRAVAKAVEATRGRRTGTEARHHPRRHRRRAHDRTRPADAQPLLRPAQPALAAGMGLPEGDGAGGRRAGAARDRVGAGTRWRKSQN